MDLGSSIIGAFAIAICTIPFVMMYFRRVNNQKKKVQILQEMAQEQNCTISEHEFCGDFVFAMDGNKNFVFFLKQKQEQSIAQFIDLSGVQACQAVKKTRIEQIDEEKVEFMDRVELLFLPKEKSKTETRFELYDDHVNPQLDGELQFVDKWSKQINDRLNHKN